MFILACDVPIVNASCSTGFVSVVQAAEPVLMSLEQFQELTPIVLVFLVTCSVYKKISS